MLRGLLILLVADVFIVAPIAQEALPLLRPVIHSMFLLSGIAIAFRSRAPTATVVALLAVVGLVAHWIYHAQPTIALQRADTRCRWGSALSSPGCCSSRCSAQDRSPCIASRER